VRGEQLAVDLAPGGELRARGGDGLLELEGALPCVLERVARLALVGMRSEEAQVHAIAAAATAAPQLGWSRPRAQGRRS
jgi:hypothetical protein